jgi:CHAT domain-containing protein/tetratricopeptide (TPR) repeat protein
MHRLRCYPSSYAHFVFGADDPSGKIRKSILRGIVILGSLLLQAGFVLVKAPVSRACRQESGPVPPPALSGGIQEREGSIPEPGKPVDREISGGETHNYQIKLDAGQFLRAVVDQRGVNLRLALYGPDDRKIADLDSPNGAQGPEPVSLIAEAAGTYRLELRSAQPNAPKGRYEIRTEERRAATAMDKARLTAERAFAEATVIGGQGTAESLRKGIEKYENVILLWRSLGDPEQEAYTLSAIGHSYSLLGEYQKTLDSHHRALPLRRAANDRRGEALTLYNLGAVQDRLGKPQQALDYYDRSLATYRSLGDRSMEAAVLGNMGVVHSGLGDQQKALALFHQALPIKRAIRDPYGEATLLNNIGLVQSNLGENQMALDAYRRARSLYQALNDRAGEGTTLNNIAALYGQMGEYQTELEYLQEVVQIKRIAGNRVEEAITLNNMGVAHGYLRDHRRSLEYYDRALALNRGVPASESTTLSNIGKAYHELGDYRRALEFHNQSLAIKREIGERRGASIALLNLGRTYHGLGEHQRALDFCHQSLQLKLEVRDRAGEAVARYNIARIHRDLNRLAEARAEIEAALAIVESLRGKVASQGLRTSYLATVQKYYELGVDLLMQMHKQRPTEGFAAAALHLSERARARSLLELLAENRADIRRGVDAALLEQERSLQRSLDAKSLEQMRLLGGKHTFEQAEVAAREMAELTREYDQVQARIRNASPHYAALTQPAPLLPHEIQSQALDSDTLLLEYALGEERSYLWAVTPTSIKSFELPSRAEIESLARRVYEMVIARKQMIANETPEQRRRRLDRADAEYPKASAELSRMLFGPVASELAEKRLLVVSDGALQYLPFAALPEPATKGQAGKRAGAPSPLIISHEIISLPSASVVPALRRETVDRKPAVKTLAVLADPVFSRDDPRVVSANRSQSSDAEDAAPLTRSIGPASSSFSTDLDRLRFSRREADEIANLADEKMRLEALDFSANRALATSEEIGQYRFLHFATHGLIDSVHPGLSSIALSLVDPEGRPQYGFLRLYDIYNLKLNADLVVLSACQTALGKEVRGEGMIGLTRGFMYAGAPRVVASLWRVDDRASAELMKRFYQGMLRQGLRPAAALRSAQISMWKDKRWQAPHYWAAFSFQGEWRQSRGEKS